MILGTIWNMETDSFGFDPKAIIQKIEDKAKSDSLFRHPTMRAIASYTAQIFDPMGWWSFVTIHARLLMQDVWLSKIEWDQRIKEPELKNWGKFQAMMKSTPYEMPVTKSGKG